MYDEFFFPYEKAKLWTRNMVLLSLSHFLLTISLYVMLLVLPLWAVRQWSCSYAEAGAAVAVFGLAMFIPGAFNSYLIDTFKRKSVCLITLLLFIVLSRLYPYTTGIGWVVLLRIVQGGLYSTTTMTTGSTLVIDVTASRRRTDANVAFAWVGRLGMGAGLVIGIYIYPYWDFICVVYVSVIAAALAWLLVTMVRVSFRAPLNPPVLSLDRFILPRALWPGINMMLIAFVFGMLIAHTYNEFFYICVLVGLVMAMVVSKYMLSDASGRSEVELGQAALVGGLLLLGLSSSLICSYIAGVLVGVGVGVSASRFFIKMISLPMHCERGTGNNTYQLLWELGILAGFFFESVWSEIYPASIYWICIGISILTLVMYEAFTHAWYYKRMEERR